MTAAVALVQRGWTVTPEPPAGASLLSGAVRRQAQSDTHRLCCETGGRGGIAKDERAITGRLSGGLMEEYLGRAATLPRARSD
jgi:hypothetical protein